MHNKSNFFIPQSSLSKNWKKKLWGSFDDTPAYFFPEKYLAYKLYIK